MIRVVKVGGSLFDWPQLPDQLWRWLELQPPAENYLVAGGGELVDVIRRADATYRLGEETSHQLSLALMETMANLLATLVERARPNHAEAANQRSVQVIHDIAERATTLPRNWNVTSDSIAAHIAEQLGAEDLVLLKSCNTDGRMTIDRAAEEGIVDLYFPSAAKKQFTVRLVNLRTLDEWRLVT